MSFTQLGLSPDIVRALEARGYTQPTPIQEKAIPVILKGSDVLAAAQTGTGKTAAFALPILQRFSESLNGKPKKHTIRVLILTPTRELCAQVQENIQYYGQHLPIRSMTMFGGVNIGPQMRQLQQGVDIVVATPGRLLDHIQQKTIDLSKINTVVLDEADRMLDMGFIHSIRHILSLLPEPRQTLLFSATFSDDIKGLAKSFLNKPIAVDVSPKTISADLIEQKVYFVSKERKSALLCHLIKQHDWYQVLVFARTKHGSDKLTKQLVREGIAAMALHGNKTQSMRTHTLDKFKRGQLQVLVATDIAARGIDISELPQVINFDLPEVAEDYVHRIGRTGRAGANGSACSLVSAEENKLLRAIERFIRKPIPQGKIEGFQPLTESSLDSRLASLDAPPKRNFERRSYAPRSLGSPRTNAPAQRANVAEIDRPATQPKKTKTQQPQAPQQSQKQNRPTGSKPRPSTPFAPRATNSTRAPLPKRRTR